ncbi:MAG: hypothetical protein ACOCYP_04175 [Planctomycetota bacterium]
MRQHREWIEALVMGLAGGLVWLVILLLPDAATRDQRTRLLPPRFPACRVISPRHSYSLLFDAPQPLLGDTDLQAIGRLRPNEAEDIAAALTSCRIVRRIPADDWRATGAEAYGLDRPLRLEIPGLSPIELGTGGGEHGYARGESGELLVLAPDPVAVLDRSPEVLRAITLDLPQPILGATHSAGWRLQREAGRWQLHSADDDPARWADEDVVASWLEHLSAIKPLGFGRDPQSPPRRRLILRGGPTGSERSVILHDHGRGPGATSRLIEREERIGDHTVREFLVCQLPDARFAPAPAALISSQLVPLDPRAADRVRIGRLLCERDKGLWNIRGIDDADHEAVADLLAGIARIERGEDPGPQVDTALLEVWHGPHHFALHHRHPELVERLAGLKLRDLRSRALIPGLGTATVTGLVIQPRDALPEFYDRDPESGWPEEYAKDITQLLDALGDARVHAWTDTVDPTAAPERVYDCTFIVSLESGATYTLRMLQDGTVAIPERGLTGELTPASRKAVIGAPDDD